ncbi:MAG: hypothetical protein Q8P24_15305 [Desulfobacterales bacterium]|nr:hypothetical protein [Desulfobacterales bacterium]
MLNVLEFMGKSGLQTGFDKKFTFSVLDVTEIFRGALKEKIRACLSSQKITNRLLLEFPNVFIFKETLNVKGQPARLAMAEGEFPLAKVLGNVANELVRWDLEDRGLADQMEKSRVDMLAEAARKSAESSITGIEIDHAALRPVDLGERASRKNNTKRSLRGFVGHVVLRGNLLPAMGWLEVLALWGGGQEKSSGLGQVKLWVPFNT